jgi:hypothetical protein
MPEAWSASELNLVLVLPSIALAGASAELELVFELAVQPVSLSAVSVWAETGDGTAWIAKAPRPAAAIAAIASRLKLLRGMCDSPSGRVRDAPSGVHSSYKA